MLVYFTTLSKTAWTTVGWFQALGRRENGVPSVYCLHMHQVPMYGDQQTTLLYTKLHNKFQLTS